MERKPQQKQKDSKTIKKLGSKAFINWCFGLMGTVILTPVLIMVLDFYWFATLISGNLTKLGLIRGMILAGLNILMILLTVTLFLLMYCTLNPVECLWETAKETVKAATGN